MDQSNFYDSIYSPIVISMSSFVIALMMVCSSMGEAMQAWFGISVGSAVAMIAYVGKVFTPLESLGMEIQNIQSALAGVHRIDEFLDEPEMIPREDAEKKEKAEIVFSHVTFGYDKEKPVFSDLNFTINPGEHVIFTGRTGIGKSTIFKLILGLYRPDKGQVRVCGQSADLIPENRRRRKFGYVEQRFAVVEGTIGEQIRMFDPSITDADIWEALTLCGMEEKVRAMPQTIGTKMQTTDFSQGELQLLSIARALAAKPEIMLLDEITASLDSLTEQKITGIIQKAAKGRTVISISHRLNEGLSDAREIHIVS